MPLPTTVPESASLASVVAIGNFDGVHRGHRHMLAALFAAGARLGVPTCVYTFDPAPTAIVAPQRHQPRLQTLAHRVATLHVAGVARIEVEPFTAAFAAWGAERFVRDVLIGRLGARALIVGHDFRFGSMRAGDADAIRRLEPAIEMIEVAGLDHGGEPISSSRVRKAIAAGDVDLAAALLGRPPSISGPVVHGQARGRTLGFPTANIEIAEEIRPAHGVYAVRTRLPDGRSVGGVANIGVRPTVGGERYAVEAHLFDVADALYGSTLELELVGRIREERRFPSMDALAAQIALDAAAARGMLR